MAQISVSKAIATYHQLLAERHLASTSEILEDAIHERNLKAGGRPVCNVLRPFFLNRSVYEKVMRASTIVMKCMSDLSARLFEDDSLRARMKLSPDEEQIIRIETGYGAHDVSARLDGFLDAVDGFRFVEYNADSPGGIGYGDALAEVFASMPVLADFGKQFPFRTIPARNRTFDALVGAFHRWGGTGLPRIAIVDWKTASTKYEFELMKEVFEAQGCQVKIVSPDELEYKWGRLRTRDMEIDLVYKRLVVFELLEKLGLEHPLVKAVRDRAVCMANGFGVQMLFQKTMFAFLSDPSVYQAKDADTARAIAAHIPWTRLVEEGKTYYDNSTIDLVDFISANREKFVLKPTSEYGGRGVVLGWESTDDEWRAALRQAIASPHIVQERVPVGSEVYPSVAGGRLKFEPRFFDLDPYVWDGASVEGCGIRLSREALLNVSAGGGSATPLFILED